METRENLGVKKLAQVDTCASFSLYIFGLVATGSKISSAGLSVSLRPIMQSGANQKEIATLRCHFVRNDEESWRKCPPKWQAQY